MWRLQKWAGDWKNITKEAVGIFRHPRLGVKRANENAANNHLLAR